MKSKELEKILTAYDKITILGHDNIDVDAATSGILLSHLLDFFHIKNEFLILEEIKENETYYIMKEQFNIDLKDYYCGKEVASRKLFLEDHYETIHKGEVVACLDHHPTKKKIDYPFYESRISCSTSYLIYELMQEVQYQITEKEAKMILVAMMIDTVSFRNTKTVEEEVIEAKQLAKQYGLNYQTLEKYCLCLSKIDNIPLDTIINNGYKMHVFSGKKVKSSYLQIYGMVEDEKLTDWLERIKQIVNEKKLAMWVFIIFEFKNEFTYEYRITNQIEKNVKKGILSRGKDIMPEIEEIYRRDNNDF